MNRTERLARLFDLLVLGGLVTLIVFTPLAIGSVLPWAYGVAEAIVFLMVAAWMAKLVLVADTKQHTYVASSGLFLPPALFALLGLVQLVPMPPALTHVLSPSTYNLYAKALSGWPQKAPFQDLMSLPPRGGPAYMTTVLPTESEVRAGAPIPSSRLARIGVRRTQAGMSSAWRWRPLTIAPALTTTILFQFLAYSSLFALVLLYPVGPPPEAAGEKRYFRVLLGAILATGLLVACLAIVERAWWNGNILWFYSPYDWAGRQLDPSGLHRARGPFVNPDHFSSYINLILPLAMMGAVFRSFLAPHRQRDSVRLTCAIIAFVLFLGIFLSLSRAGWIGALVGVSVLLWLSSFIASGRRPAILRLSRSAVAAIAAAGLVLLLAASTLYVGGSGRTDANARIHETIGQNPTFRARLAMWEDALPMLRDFPVFGVGLGCFQELFPHYERPPWPLQSITQAHNDYLQLALEAGLAGFAMLAWFFAGIGRRLYASLRSISSESLPVAAALMAGMSAMAFQEFFDFNLQIPANAILMTILIALAIRLARIPRRNAPAVAALELPSKRIPAKSIAAAAIVLAAAAMLQPKVPYPYNLTTPATPAQALQLVLEHPAVSTTHEWLIGALGQRLSRAQRAQRLAVAVWLNPTEPYARDAYAQTLMWKGQNAEAAKQITRSIFNAPWTSVHAYLNPRLIPYLSPSGRAAIEKGFRMAVEHNFAAAVWSATGFYEAERSYRAEAELYEEAARHEPEPGARSQFLVNAGLFYSEVHEDEQAEAAFGQAAALAPSDPKAYGYLATRVFAQRKDLKSAEATIEEGIKQGADPFALNLALAEASEACGDPEAAEEALLKALKEEPYDFETIWRLGSLYMRGNRYDQAALWMRKATEIRPDSAEAFYQLALAEEGGYEYFEAGRDFREALRLAPQNTEIKNRYAEFTAKLAAGRKDLPSADSSPVRAGTSAADSSSAVAGSSESAPRDSDP